MTKRKPAAHNNNFRIVIPAETCSDYYFATQKEWIDTNGLGGFASSTVIGANVRRYHGLLVASLKPPTHRFVLVSKLEDSVSVNGNTYELGTNQYPMIVHPEGHKHIDRFEYDLNPRIYYTVPGCRVEKSLLMVHGKNTTVIRYTIQDSDGPVMLYVRPLCAFRDYHSLAHETSRIDQSVQILDKAFSIKPYEHLPRLSFLFNRGKCEAKFFWYKNAEFRKEQERGLDFTEDLFSHGFIKTPLNPGETFDLMMTIEPESMESAPAFDEVFEKEISRRKAIVEGCSVGEPFGGSLSLAADSFIVKRGPDRHTIIAGYHWFGDWGRDTMIALRGLTLSCRRYDVAKDILRAFSDYVSKGMIPNRFPDLEENPEYNNVDGTLWYFVAVFDYLRHSGDTEFIRDEVYPVLHTIIEWHLKGTRYNIHMDADGLLFAGEPGVQLTWMDAKVGDWVVTPRIGKPVEINALWYNALCIMRDLAEKFGEPDRATSYATLADRVQEHFNTKFWNPVRNCLYDVIGADGPDDSIRPNQIFAVSLPFSPIARTKQRAIVDRVRSDLLTPYGLRSLSPDHPDYKGRYGGDVMHRDGAYHQGTVWTWLLGPYIEAWLKTENFSDEAISEALERLKPIEKMFSDAGIGTVSEIYDGDEPHYPNGCISQAWSVGELLRIMELIKKRGA